MHHLVSDSGLQYGGWYRGEISNRTSNSTLQYVYPNLPLNLNSASLSASELFSIRFYSLGRCSSRSDADVWLNMADPAWIRAKKD